MSSSSAHVLKLNSFLNENARPPMPFMVETAQPGKPGSIETPGSHNKALLPGDGGHVHHPEDQGEPAAISHMGSPGLQEGQTPEPLE